jgi:hypothetical protein
MGVSGSYSRGGITVLDADGGGMITHARDGGAWRDGGIHLDGSVASMLNGVIDALGGLLEAIGFGAGADARFCCCIVFGGREGGPLIFVGLSDFPGAWVNERFIDLVDVADGICGAFGGVGFADAIVTNECCLVLVGVIAVGVAFSSGVCCMIDSCWFFDARIGAERVCMDFVDVADGGA